MYAANITGDLDQMLERLIHIEANKGTCTMVSMNSIGLPAMKIGRKHSKVVIHGHRNGWGMLGRSPATGMSFIAFQKLWRLAGIDHTHVNGLRNKFCEFRRVRHRLRPRLPNPHVSIALPRMRDHTERWEIVLVLCIQRNRHANASHTRCCIDKRKIARR